MSTTTEPTLARRPWRTVDVVVASVVAVAFGVVFWAWGALWNALGPLFTALPPAQGFMYGVWLVPGVLVMLIVRKPGAALYGAVLAAAVSWLLGSWWGLTVVWWAVFQGLLPELVFAATRYRRFTAAVATLAGAAAGLAPVVLDRIYYYPNWSGGWVVLYAALVVPSSAAIAGLGSWYLTRALAGAGVLDAFAAGRDRAQV